MGGRGGERLEKADQARTRLPREGGWEWVVNERAAAGGWSAIGLMTGV